MSERLISDADAMDLIHAFMNVESWSPTTLDRIADVVAATGRTFDDEPESYDSETVRMALVDTQEVW